MKIIVTWRFSTAPGKSGKGLEWAKKSAVTGKKGGFAPQKTWFLRPRTGDGDRFSVAGQFASFAAYEKYLEERDADSGWQVLGKEMGDSDWYVGVETIIAQVVEEI